MARRSLALSSSGCSSRFFRQAGRQGIIAEVEAWFAYLKGRNLTSHSDNEKTAEETYLLATRFLPDAELLLKELRRRCEPGHH